MFADRERYTGEPSPELPHEPPQIPLTRRPHFCLLGMDITQNVLTGPIPLMPTSGGWSIHRKWSVQYRPRVQSPPQCSSACRFCRPCTPESRDCPSAVRLHIDAALVAAHEHIAGILLVERLVAVVGRNDKLLRLVGCKGNEAVHEANDDGVFGLHLHVDVVEARLLGTFGDAFENFLCGDLFAVLHAQCDTICRCDAEMFVVVLALEVGIHSPILALELAIGVVGTEHVQRSIC